MSGTVCRLDRLPFPLVLGNRVCIRNPPTPRCLNRIFSFDYGKLSLLLATALDAAGYPRTGGLSGYTYLVATRTFNSMQLTPVVVDEGKDLG